MKLFKVEMLMGSQICEGATRTDVMRFMHNIGFSAIVKINEIQDAPEAHVDEDGYEWEVAILRTPKAEAELKETKLDAGRDQAFEERYALGELQA